jgi:hypothetical protein
MKVSLLLSDNNSDNQKDRGQDDEGRMKEFKCDVMMSCLSGKDTDRLRKHLEVVVLDVMSGYRVSSASKQVEASAK